MLGRPDRQLVKDAIQQILKEKSRTEYHYISTQDLLDEVNKRVGKVGFMRLRNILESMEEDFLVYGYRRPTLWRRGKLG
jgi:hypothetical protein